MVMIVVDVGGHGSVMVMIVMVVWVCSGNDGGHGSVCNGNDCHGCW